jgi:predicted nucleotidyltransferase component of viral defense system
MIDREEILELAREFQLPANTVEKDYALGWLLAGISSHHALRDSWVFKGGTCLKKCFFETYRFFRRSRFHVARPGAPGRSLPAPDFHRGRRMGL